MGKPHTLSLVLSIALMLLLVLFCQIAYANDTSYTLVDESESNLTRDEAEEIAFRFYVSSHDDIADEVPVSSNRIKLGRWFLFSHFIGITDEKSSLHKVWFVSILSCKENKDLDWDGIWKASVAIDDTTGQIIFFSERENCEWYDESYEFLVSDEDEYAIERAMFLIFPQDMFRMALIPEAQDISREEAIQTAFGIIQTIEGIDIDRDRYHVEGCRLMSYGALCSENIWCITISDTYSDYPHANLYLCEVYASHNVVWYLGKLDLNRLSHEPLPYDYIYIDNRFINYPVDMTLIPSREFHFLGYDSIIAE